MQNNKIGLYQTGILSFFLSRSFLMMGLIPLLFQVSGIDSLISILLGTLLGLGIVLFFHHLMKKQKNSDILSNITHLFPRPFAFFFQILLLSILFVFGFFLLSQFSVYINNSYRVDASPFLIALLFLGICVYFAKGGLETIARGSEILFFLWILLFLFSFLGILPGMEPNRLKPFFSQEWFKIGSSSFLYGLCTSLPLFFLTFIPISSIQKKEKAKKAIGFGYCIGTLSIFLLFVWMIGTLGIDLASYYQYPETAILKKISYFQFVERVEGILSIHYLFDSTVTLTLLFYNIKKIIQSFSFAKATNIIYGILLCAMLLCSYRLSLSLSQLLLPLAIIFLSLPCVLLLQLKFSKTKKSP